MSAPKLTAYLYFLLRHALVTPEQLEEALQHVNTAGVIYDRRDLWGIAEQLADRIVPPS